MNTKEILTKYVETTSAEKLAVVAELNSEIELFLSAKLGAPDVNIKADYTYGVEFRRKRDDETYLTNIFTLYFRNNYSTGEAQDVELNYYTTGCTTEFELNRLILLGEVAKVVKNESDVIVDEVNRIIRSYSSRMTLLIRNIAEAVEALRKIRVEEKEAEKEVLREKLENGITFENYLRVDLKKSFSVKSNFFKVERPVEGKKTTKVTYLINAYIMTEERVNYESFVNELFYVMNRN